jgi:hypothetical protein
VTDRQRLAAALMAPAAMPLQRRDFPVMAEPFVPFGVPVMQNQPDRAFPLDQVDTATPRLRGQAPQTVSQTARDWATALDVAGASGGVTRGLPMDAASRAARARDMGFRKEQFYHGTGSDIAVFDPDSVRQVISAGGHWITRDPRLAEGYAPVPQPRHIDPLGISQGGNMLPLRVRAQNIGTFAEYGAAHREAMERGIDLRDLMRERGIDAFVTQGTPRRPHTMVVRDPEMLRVSHATFDPARKDSADLLAMLLGGVGLGAGATQAEAAR